MYKLFLVRFRYRHCCVRVIMRTSSYFKFLIWPSEQFKFETLPQSSSAEQHFFGVVRTPSKAPVSSSTQMRILLGPIRLYLDCNETFRFKDLGNFPSSNSNFYVRAPPLSTLCPVQKINLCLLSTHLSALTNNRTAVSLTGVSRRCTFCFSELLAANM